MSRDLFWNIVGAANQTVTSAVNGTMHALSFGDDDDDGCSYRVCQQTAKMSMSVVDSVTGAIKGYFQITQPADNAVCYSNVIKNIGGKLNSLVSRCSSTLRSGAQLIKISAVPTNVAELTSYVANIGTSCHCLPYGHDDCYPAVLVPYSNSSLGTYSPELIDASECLTSPGRKPS